MAGPDEAPLFAEGEGDTFYDRQLKLLSLKTEKKRTQPFWRVEDPIIDEYRRVLVGGMWDYQRKIWLAPNFIKVLVGGYGCIVGDQEVYDPVAGVRRTVSDLGELNTVSLDTSTERLRVNESLAVPKGVKDCVHVSLDDGSSIKLTTDHPLYTSRGWIKAGELLMTDLVATPSYLPEGPGVSASDDEIKFIAYMMADGSCVNSCVFHKNNEGILADMEGIVSRLGGTSYRDTSAACTALRISGLRPLLVKYQINTKSKYKRLPAEWYGLNKHQASLFLACFLSCDAHIGEKNLDLALASEGLIRDIRHLLLVLGIKSSTTYKKANIGDKLYDAWRLCVSPDYNTLLSTVPFVGRAERVNKAKKHQLATTGHKHTDIIPVSRKEVALIAKNNNITVKAARGFTSARPEAFLTRSKLAAFRDHYLLKLGAYEKHLTSDIRWVRIDSITPIGKHEVFDLSVDNDHNFVCNNVVVHNSGKTNLGSKRIIALALENAPIPVATVSPTFSIARRTVVPQISEFLLAKQNQFGSAFDWRYNSGVHEFKIRFEGRNALIQVLSGENPLSLRGPNLAAAFMDEPFIQDWAVFEQLVARIRHPDAVRKELLLAGTPDLVVSDWGQDLCAGNLKGFKDIAVVRASTRGNKSLGPEYVERLEGMLSEKAAKVYLDGYFLNLSEGLVYYGFDTEDHVVDLAIPRGAELGAGMDFNVNPMSMCVFWVKDGHMHIMDEFELPNADTEYACQVLVERYWNMGLRTVYPDATGRNRSTKAPGGKSDFHFIRDAGFSVVCRQENPQRKDRYNSVNSKFKSKLGKISLTVSPKCKSLIKYLTLYSHENLNKQEHMSHLLDSMGYPCAYLFPVDRETLSVRTIIGV